MSERFPSSPINRNAVLRSYHSRNIPALGDPERHVHVAGEPDSLGNLYCACGASLGNPDLEALLEAEEAEEAFYSRQHVGQCSICGHLDHDASAHPAWIGWADERPTVVCAAGVHVWDRRDENAPIEPGDLCKKCLYTFRPLVFDVSGTVAEPPIATTLEACCCEEHAYVARANGTAVCPFCPVHGTAPEVS